MFGLPYYSIFLCISASILTVSLIFDVVPTIIARPLALFYFLGTGALIARQLMGRSKTESILLAPLSVIVPIGILGSILYGIVGLTLPVIIILLWLPFICALLTAQSPFPAIPNPRSQSRVNSVGDPVTLKNSGIPPLPWGRRLHAPHNDMRIFLGMIYIISIALLFAILFSSQTTDAILGPWDGMPPTFFAVFFIASFLLAALFWLGVPRAIAAILLSAHFAIAISVALIRFPLSFGFDPILHQAAEKLVIEQGVVTPKTMYYLAQYALVPFFARVFDAGATAIHQPLTLVMVGLSLPVFLLAAITAFLQNAGRHTALLALCILAIPFPHLIMTTPWGLAYGTTLFVLLSSAYAVSTRARHAWIIPISFALLALSLHPLAGIPLLFFILLLNLRAFWLRALFVLAGSVSIPLAFIAHSILSPGFHLTFALPALRDIMAVIARNDAAITTRFSPLLDAVYFVSQYGGIIFCAVALIGIVIAIRARQIPHFLQTCLLSAFFIAVAGLLTGALIRFDALAAFEQMDYARRLFEIASLFLLPFGAAAAAAFFSRLRAAPALLRIVALIAFAGLFTATLYLSYPRNDAYTPSHAYTLSQTDINAAHWISNHAVGDDIIVLANQVVASAAIREYGFKKYYMLPEGPLFYYPIPSGSPLLPYYLSMLRAPSRETAKNALNIAGGNRLYFVVRDYEFRFPIIVRDAKATADEWQKIDGGKAYVFLYKKILNSETQIRHPD